jgi:RNA polymerase primary sigma factor
VVEIQRIAQEPVSLQSPIGEEGHPISGLHRGRRRGGADRGGGVHLLQDQLFDILNALSDREQRIIQLRFGSLTDIPGRLRRSAGSSVSPARESDQIESKTLAKLRHPSRAQMLREYLE